MRKTMKILATGVAILGLMAALPQAALADEDNIWRSWYAEVTDREKPEIPFAILFSLTAMILTTPFWLGGMAIDMLSDDDE